MTSTTPTTGTTTGLNPPELLGEIDLEVEGMTCASCVARVEKRLNRLPGVNATVNLATDSAHVELTSDVPDEELVATLRSAGYDGRVRRRTGVGAPEPDSHGGHDHDPLGDDADPYDTSSPTERRTRDLGRRLVWALVLGIPVGVLSMTPPLQFPGWQWLVMALALPIATWAAWPFHTAAFRAARYGSSTMDTLVSLGVIASTAWSLWAILLGGAGEIGMRMDMSLIPRAAGEHAVPHLYFETAALIVVFLLAGRYAEARSRHRAGDALRALLELGAKDVARVSVAADGTRTEERIPVERLAEGDLFMVRPGEKIATDGVVAEGTSAVDTSLLTGEPVPVDVGPGTEVTGATINTSGALLVRATRVGEETTLAQIGRLVTRAQTGKAPVQRLADRISAVFVPVVVVLAVVVLVGWLLLGGSTEQAFTAAVAVLVIACPCALGLATPTALLVGTGRAANLGVLVKGPEILESTRRIDTIVLDKTGTVTAGRMSLTEVTPAGGAPVAVQVRPAATADDRGDARDAGSDGSDDSDHVADRHDDSDHVGDHDDRGDVRDERRDVVAPSLGTAPAASAVAGRSGSSLEEVPRTVPTSPAQVALAVAAAVEAGSEHPVARAVTEAAEARGLALPEVSGFTNHTGTGVSATVTIDDAAHDAYVGRPAWLTDLGVDVGPVAEAFEATEASGATAVVVAWDGTARAVLAVRDEVRPTSPEAIAELKELGLRPHLLTGDNLSTAHEVAGQVGIAPADVTAGVLPADKVDVVRRLQEDGRVVAMVGDGVNDAAALAQADLGLAMGSGTDIAIEAADLTLVRADLAAVPVAVRISRATLRIIKQNLFWAFAYNVAAIPLAAAGLLNPGLAAAAMAASSVIVVLNSLRLRSAG